MKPTLPTRLPTQWILIGCILFPSLLYAFAWTFPPNLLKQYGEGAIHGYDVNGDVVVYFQGDTRSLNKYLKKVATTTYGERSAVLHVGQTFAGSPWDKKDGQDKAKEKKLVDWRADTIRRENNRSHVTARITVHIWLGNNIILDDLEIPSEFTVSSGGEIDAFIRDREKKDGERKLP